MWNKNIQTFIGLEASFDEAECVIFGAPMDSTTSYRPGTRFASSSMRQESFGLETYSPYQDKDLEDIKVFDGRIAVKKSRLTPKTDILMVVILNYHLEIPAKH